MVAVTRSQPKPHNQWKKAGARKRFSSHFQFLIFKGVFFGLKFFKKVIFDFPWQTSIDIKCLEDFKKAFKLQRIFKPKIIIGQFGLKTIFTSYNSKRKKMFALTAREKSFCCEQIHFLFSLASKTKIFFFLLCTCQRKDQSLLQKYFSILTKIRYQEWLPFEERITKKKVLHILRPLELCFFRQYKHAQISNQKSKGLPLISTFF